VERVDGRAVDEGDHGAHEGCERDGGDERQDQPIDQEARPPEPGGIHERNDREGHAEDGRGDREQEMDGARERALRRHRGHGTAARGARSLRGVGGLVALGAVAAFAALAWTASPRPPSGDPAGAATADASVVEAGRGLFQANCASCHGAQGQGGAGGPSLVTAGAAAADFYLRTGRMPLSAPGQRVVRQPPRFSDTEIRALVAYVASLDDGPPIPQVAGGGDLHRGWELFQANCAACHAATGTGNAIGGGFVAVGLGQADQTTIAEATVIGPGAMPAFSFDEQELSDLAAYVQWLHDAPSPGGATVGNTGPVAEGFIGVAIGLPALLLAAAYVARHGRGLTAHVRASVRGQGHDPDDPTVDR
jgi:ubiquinol-cytochrome c reductase cytochrome c subunit